MISLGPCGPAVSYFWYLANLFDIGKSTISFLGIRGLGDYVSGCSVTLTPRRAVASRISSELGERHEEAWTVLQAKVLCESLGPAVVGSGEVLGMFGQRQG